jgi:DNA replication protein DnaC
MENRKKITPLHSKSRVSGMSDQELLNVQAHIERLRKEKEQQQQQQPEESSQPMTSTKKILEFDREAFQRQLQEFSERRRSREPEYDGPMSPLPHPEAKYTHTCPDCGYKVNTADTHGYKRAEKPNSYDVYAIPCPTCSPVVKRHQNAKKAKQYIQDLVHERFFTDICNLPDDAASCTFAEFEYLSDADTTARDAVMKFVEGQTKELLLWGETGRCKTGLAISAIHELKAHGVSCLMLPMKQYLDLLREDNARSKKGEPSTHIRQIARGVEVLLIDDLGVDRITDSGFAVEETQGLIEDRHTMGLRTIITTNMSLAGLEQYWHMEKYEKYGFQPGARIVSRLKGWYKVVHVAGIDQRIGE